MFWNEEEARALERAISRGRYPSAYAMLRKRTELLIRSEAEPCLQAALYRSPLLFRGLLEKCVPGEHTGSVPVKLGEDTEAQVEGTLLVLAAAAVLRRVLAPRLTAAKGEALAVTLCGWYAFAGAVLLFQHYF